MNAKKAPVASELVPPAYQDRLLQVRGAADAEFWEVGDVAHELEEAEPDLDRRRALRNAIADLAGVTAKTVGEYKSHAEYYPPEVRQKFPALTRWHFRRARVWGNLATSLEWLTKAAESADDYGGKPMPVDVLAARIAEARGSHSPDTVEFLRRELERTEAQQARTPDGDGRRLLGELAREISGRLEWLKAQKEGAADAYPVAAETFGLVRNLEATHG